MSRTCMHCSRPVSCVAQLRSSEHRPSRLDRTVSTSSRDTGALFAAIAVPSVRGLLCCVDVVTNIPLTVISRLHMSGYVSKPSKKHKVLYRHGRKAPRSHGLCLQQHLL